MYISTSKVIAVKLVFFFVKLTFLGTLSAPGVIYGITASMFVALNAIFTQRTLPSVGDSITQLTL